MGTHTTQTPCHTSTETGRATSAMYRLVSRSDDSARRVLAHYNPRTCSWVLASSLMNCFQLLYCAYVDTSGALSRPRGGWPYSA